MGLKDAMTKLIENMKFAKTSDDILKLVDNPEMAVKLTGAPRERYLNALNEIQGPKDVRIKDMGFSPETYYHGTSSDFDKFNSSKAKSGQLFGRGNYVTQSPEEASIYAQKLDQHTGIPLEDDNGVLYPLRVRKGNQFDVVGGEFDPNLAKKLSVNLDPKDRKTLASIEDNYNFHNFIQGKVSPTDLSKGIVDSGYDTVKVDSHVDNIINKKDLRSVNAAFDKRFAKSPLLLAGAGAVPTDMNPLDALGSLVNSYREKQGQVADAITDRVSQPFGGADQGLKNLGRMVMDPVNLVEGPLGIGLTAAEMMARKGK